MSERPASDQWVTRTATRLAHQHFPGRASALESLVREAAKNHETIWRSSAQGVFRPTPSMYAPGLRWQFDKLGPVCALCHGKVVISERLPPSGPTRNQLVIRPRGSGPGGGLNVPQNLVAAHARCVSDR